MAVTHNGAAAPVTVTAGAGAGATGAEVVLEILDSDLKRAPTVLNVTVGGADDDSALTFDIDGTTVWTDDADPEGQLGATSIPVTETVCPTAGTYTLTVTASNGSDSVDFTLAMDAPGPLIVLGPDTDPVFIPGSTGHWVLQDLMAGGLGSWIMPIAPDQMTNPHVQRSVVVEHTTAPVSGQYEVVATAVLAKPWRLQGYYPDQVFHDKVAAYAALRRRFYVIDHRGRAWKVIASDFTAEPRKRQSDDVSPDNDWSGRWTMDLNILDQTLGGPA